MSQSKRGPDVTPKREPCAVCGHQRRYHWNHVLGSCALCARRGDYHAFQWPTAQPPDAAAHDGDV